MNISMVGIDHSKADIEIRERFSFTGRKMAETYDYFKEIPQILGSVILSTCNRSEIYFSLGEQGDFDPFAALCDAVGADYNRFHDYCVLRHGDEVFDHLSLLGAGAKSLIWGEDQIITQVKTAIETAREQKAADGLLETTFRFAITAAKEIKTKLTFDRAGSSVAADVLSHLKDSEVKRVLVIGNGEVGRLVAALLVKAGFETTMTLRQYKHTENLVPVGCFVLPYEERYEGLAACDAVVSATSSPHHTIEKAPLLTLAACPRYFFDLAVPRDIDPTVGELEGVFYYNVDSLSKNGRDYSVELAKMEEIIDKYKEKQMKWYVYRERACV